MTTATRPRFSVVTCCYNQGSYLADNLRAVLAQAVPDFEHIVVDDGSTDNTRAVCAEFPHVRYIHQSNAGQSAALNRGFQEARGEIIAWVNSDDYHEPGAFGRVARELDPARGRWIVAGAANVVNADGRFMWKLPNGRVSFHRLLFHPRLYPHRGWTVMPCQPSVFFHRRVLDELGPLDTRLKYAMDYEYWLRALTHGFRFHYVPQVFSNYRYHPTSNTNQGYDTFLGEWQEVSRRYYDRLSPARRWRAEAWWAYARVECVFVGRHKTALEQMGAQWNPGARLGVVARATLRAPWIPATLLWHAARRAAGRQAAPHP
jgi:glycosyltransferase involved in cell wall biosynthesis